MLRFVSGPCAAWVDVDVFSSTAGTDDRVYAATLAGFGSLAATLLDVIASDGTMVREGEHAGRATESVSNPAETIVAVVEMGPERVAPQWSVMKGVGVFNGSFVINCDGSGCRRGCEVSDESNTGETLWSVK